MSWPRFFTLEYTQRRRVSTQAAKWKIACSLLYSEGNDIGDQATTSERIALLLKKRVVSDAWHIEGEDDSAAVAETKKRGGDEAGPAVLKKLKSAVAGSDSDAEDAAKGV